MQREAIDRVVQRVSEVYGVPVCEIRTPGGQSRNGSSGGAHARQAVWYLLYRYGGMTLVSLGAEFGRDHSTISNGVRRFAERVRNEPEERALLLDAMGVFDNDSNASMRRRVEAELDHARDVVRRLEGILGQLERQRVAQAGPRRRIAA